MKKMIGVLMAIVILVTTVSSLGVGVQAAQLKTTYRHSGTYDLLSGGLIAQDEALASEQIRIIEADTGGYIARIPPCRYGGWFYVLPELNNINLADMYLHVGFETETPLTVSLYTDLGRINLLSAFYGIEMCETGRQEFCFPIYELYTWGADLSSFMDYPNTSKETSVFNATITRIMFNSDTLSDFKTVTVDTLKLSPEPVFSSGCEPSDPAQGCVFLPREEGKKPISATSDKSYSLLPDDLEDYTVVQEGLSLIDQPECKTEITKTEESVTFKATQNHQILRYVSNDPSDWIEVDLNDEDLYINWDIDFHFTAWITIYFGGVDPDHAGQRGCFVNLLPLMSKRAGPKNASGWCADTYVNGRRMVSYRLADLLDKSLEMPGVLDELVSPDGKLYISGMEIGLHKTHFLKIRDLSIGPRAYPYVYSVGKQDHYDRIYDLKSIGDVYATTDASHVVKNNDGSVTVKTDKGWNKTDDTAHGAVFTPFVTRIGMDHMYLHIGVTSNVPFRIMTVDYDPVSQKTMAFDLANEFYIGPVGQRPANMDANGKYVYPEGGFFPAGTYKICAPYGDMYRYYEKYDNTINIALTNMSMVLFETKDKGQLTVNTLKLSNEKTFSTNVIARRYPDVSTKEWFYDAVEYVSEREIMTGYQIGNFGPANTLKRQDFVVTLSRVAGVDLTLYENDKLTFTDVKMGAYYGPSVAWAVENGIITGYNEHKFGVGDTVNREQVATILYRFCGSPVVENVDETLKAFPDAYRISGYAKEAMAWAVQNGVISGLKSGKIAPKSGATRAQIATILMRMDQAGLL